jgi:hypothetical protein
MPQSQKTQWLAAVIKILDGQEQRVFGIRELAALLTRLPLELTNAYRSPAAKVQALQSAGALRAVDLFLAQG